MGGRGVTVPRPNLTFRTLLPTGSGNHPRPLAPPLLPRVRAVVVPGSHLVGEVALDVAVEGSGARLNAGVFVEAKQVRFDEVEGRRAFDDLGAGDVPGTKILDPVDGGAERLHFGGRHPVDDVQAVVHDGRKILAVVRRQRAQKSNHFVSPWVYRAHSADYQSRVSTLVHSLRDPHVSTSVHSLNL